MDALEAMVQSPDIVKATKVLTIPIENIYTSGSQLIGLCVAFTSGNRKSAPNACHNDGHYR